MTLPEAYARERYQPEVSDRSRGVGLALGFFGGIFGLHRFYVGKTQSAIAMILTFGGMGIWWLYDMVLLAAGEFRDVDDLPLRRWSVDDPQHPAGGGPSARQVEDLEQRLEALQGQFNDLAERVDFAERMLTQHRERQLPPGRG